MQLDAFQEVEIILTLYNRFTKRQQAKYNLYFFLPFKNICRSKYY